MQDSLNTKKLSFPSGSRLLRGRLFGARPTNAKRSAILFIHGQGSNQRGYEHRARLASVELDSVCLTFDLSGHGDDAAHFNLYSPYEHLEDTIAAYDCLASQNNIDTARIGVCGASYGGYLAGLLTAHRAVKQLLLRAPSLASGIEFSASPPCPSTRSVIPDGFDSLKVLAKYSGQVLIVESEKDEVIPKAHIRAYLRTCSRVQHKIILEARHAMTNPRWEEVFVKAIVTWFRGL